jgi:hypothetical protein
MAVKRIAPHDHGSIEMTPYCKVQQPAQQSAKPLLLWR